MEPVWKWLVVLVAGCQPAVEPVYASRASFDDGDAPRLTGMLDDRMIDFRFDGGQLEFELYRDGTRVMQAVRNRYAVPVTMHWMIGALDNLEPISALAGRSGRASRSSSPSWCGGAPPPATAASCRFTPDLVIHACGRGHTSTPCPIPTA
jgi:hypothetical protein